MTEYQVLDVTAGPKWSWLQKNYSTALFMDKRVERPGFYEYRPNTKVSPDIKADFTGIPFGDGSFNLVYFDPPHLIREEEPNFHMGLVYGYLCLETWKVVILDGLTECWRGLRPGGTLIFKWSDVDYSAQQVIDDLPFGPLFGSRVGRNNNTIWYCFYKTDLPV